MTYLESIASSVNQLMKENKKFIYLGEDVISGQKGISDGFYQKYGRQTGQWIYKMLFFRMDEW